MEDGVIKDRGPVRHLATKSNWVITEKSSQLRGRKGKDTNPEILLRKAIHKKGGRFRVDRLIVDRFRADIVFYKRTLAIMVDGCFWHGCPVHGRTTWNGPNSLAWQQKLANTKKRDLRATRRMQETGWRVKRFWECFVIENPDYCAEEIMGMLKATSDTL